MFRGVSGAGCWLPPGRRRPILVCVAVAARRRGRGSRRQVRQRPLSLIDGRGAVGAACAQPQRCDDRRVRPPTVAWSQIAIVYTAPAPALGAPTIRRPSGSRFPTASAPDEGVVSIADSHAEGRPTPALVRVVR